MVLKLVGFLYDLSMVFMNLTPMLPLILISSLSGLERLSRVDLYLGDKGSDNLDAITSSKCSSDAGLVLLANE